MRIDDLNGASQARESSRTVAVRPEGTTGNGPASLNTNSDAAAFSALATALAPSDARIEALCSQVERGDYRVSAGDIADGIINEHTS